MALMIGTAATQINALVARGADYVTNPNNQLSNPRDFSDWAIRTAQPVQDMSMARIDGTMGAYKCTRIGDKGQDIYRIGPGSGGVSARSYKSFWIKKISLAGKLHIGEPNNTAVYGDFMLDFSLIDTGWNFITDSHPAVTVISTSVYTHGYQIWNDNPAQEALLSFYIDHIEGSNTPNPYTQTG